MVVTTPYNYNERGLTLQIVELRLLGKLTIFRPAKPQGLLR